MLKEISFDRNLPVGTMSTVPPGRPILSVREYGTPPLFTPPAVGTYRRTEMVTQRLSVGKQTNHRIGFILSRSIVKINLCVLFKLSKQYLSKCLSGYNVIYRI